MEAKGRLTDERIPVALPKDAHKRSIPKPRGSGRRTGEESRGFDLSTGDRDGEVLAAGLLERGGELFDRVVFHPVDAVADVDVGWLRIGQVEAVLDAAPGERL